MDNSKESEADYSCLPDLVGHLLGLAHLHVSQLCTQMMTSIKLTPKQWVALEFISNNPNVSQGEIAAHIGTTPTVMVAVLDALTKRGLVQRVMVSSDRRRRHVVLTEEGGVVLQEARRLAFEVEEVFSAETNLTPTERTILLTILRKITRRESPQKPNIRPVQN